MIFLIQAFFATVRACSRHSIKEVRRLVVRNSAVVERPFYYGYAGVVVLVTPQLWYVGQSCNTRNIAYCYYYEITQFIHKQLCVIIVSLTSVFEVKFNCKVELRLSFYKNPFACHTRSSINSSELDSDSSISLVIKHCRIYKCMSGPYGTTRTLFYQQYCYIDAL